MNGLVHPFSGALYEIDDPERRTIRVTDGDQVGVFTKEGRWLEGELRECDPHLCGWVGNRQVMRHKPLEDADGRA